MTGSDGDLRLFYVEQGCQKTNALFVGLALNGWRGDFLFSEHHPECPPVRISRPRQNPDLKSDAPVRFPERQHNFCYLR